MVCAKVLNSYKSHLKGLQEFRLNDSFDLDHQWTDEDLKKKTVNCGAEHTERRNFARDSGGAPGSCFEFAVPM